MIGHFTDKVVHAFSETLAPTARSTRVSYPNGDRYEGETCGTPRATRHGYGVYHYRSGRGRYEGESVDGEKHGHGILFFGDGDVYVGQWRSDRQHGHGVHVHWAPQAGVWVYEGEFRGGQREGSGALVLRERGALLGTWAGGALARGVQVMPPPEAEAEPGEVGAWAIGVDAPGELPDALGVHGAAAGAASGEQQGAAARTPLGRRPGSWRAAEVLLWLRGLGLEEAPERATLPLSGEQLLAAQDAEQLAAQCHQSEDATELAQSWRRTLAAAHSALVGAAVRSEGRLDNWEDFQNRVASVRDRIIPLAELSVSKAPDGAARVQTGSWKRLTVEVFSLPLCLPFARSSRASTSLPHVSTVAAQGWARDLEVLASLHGHANIRSLLGVTLVPLEARPGTAALALVHEASASGKLLFEWIHASLPDGSRRPMDFRSQLRICIGLCDGLKALSSKGLSLGALCSVNVELAVIGGQLVPKIMRAGASWWRWGWRESLRARAAGQPRQQAQTVQEIVRRYAACPVNWLAPEVLRGGEPHEAADIYSFGLLLWEMLYRAIPFGDYSIAQIVGAVGYGGRQVRAVASPGASTETSLLHEAVSRCAQGEPAGRPSCARLLQTLRETSELFERRKAKRSVLGKLGDKAEGFLASNLLSSGLQRSLYGSDLVPRGAAAAAAGVAAEPDEEGPRMVRLASGEWVQVDEDLVETFPGDEEKWRALMEFRAMLPARS